MLSAFCRSAEITNREKNCRPMRFLSSKYTKMRLWDSTGGAYSTSLDFLAAGGEVVWLPLLPKNPTPASSFRPLASKKLCIPVVDLDKNLAHMAWNLPHDAHFSLLSILTNSLPMTDELAKRSVRFIQRCLTTDSPPLVKFIANYGIYVGRMHFPIGCNAFFLCTVWRYNWWCITVKCY